MGWPIGNQGSNARKLWRLLKARGGKIVIHCNFKSTQAAALAMEQECTVLIEGYMATITLWSPEELAEIKQKRREERLEARRAERRQK